MNLPEPAITRLCMALRLLEQLADEGQARVLSSELGERLGVSAHSLRKDFCYLPEQSARRKGYEVAALAEGIRELLRLDRVRKACIVGLGRVGLALLQYPGFDRRGYRIVAGFDANPNKVETLKADIALYAAYEIESVLPRLGIDLGVIAVPAAAAQGVADRLVAGGVKGILNFAPVTIKTPPGVVARNLDFIRELDVLAALVRT